ncbi:MAG TPA: hypothetical protein VJ824_16230 [Bacillota bacterium]|nr:hypothetical protein [Bacillota bacterium]
MAEKANGKLETIFYIFVIPLLFTLILTGILLNFLGYPVISTMEHWGSKIPVVKNFVPGAEKQNADSKEEGKSTEAGQAQDQTAKQQDAKQQTNANQSNANQNSDTQKQIDDLKKQNEELQKQLEAKKSQENQDKIQQAAGLFANMSSSKAVNIIEAMSIDEAAYSLSGLDEEQQSSILGAFKDPKKAANVSALMKEIALGSDEKQVKVLAQKLQSPNAVLTDTISVMPAAQSAVIIQNMMTMSQKDAMDVMKSLNTTTRSQILAELAKQNPKLAAMISANLNK